MPRDSRTVKRPPAPFAPGAASTSESACAVCCARSAAACSLRPLALTMPRSGSRIDSRTVLSRISRCMSIKRGQRARERVGPEVRCSRACMRMAPPNSRASAMRGNHLKDGPLGAFYPEAPALQHQLDLAVVLGALADE